MKVLPLIVMFALYPWPGEPPVFRDDAYLGAYDSGRRQWIFVMEPEDTSAALYVSGTGWTHAYEMKDGRLPADILMMSSETAWALACWRAALTRHHTPIM